MSMPYSFRFGMQYVGTSFRKHTLYCEYTILLTISYFDILDVIVLLWFTRFTCGFLYRRIVQAALPQILENTKEDFFKGIIGLLKESSEICYRQIKENKYIICPHKPEGSMFVMVSLFCKVKYFLRECQ